MAEWRRRTVSNGDIDLAVFEQGEADNPTVVLVHGWPDTHHLWTHVAPAIVDAGYHVVAYDTRGYGETSAPDGDDPYRLAELATDLFAVIEAASDSGAHVVAHDWGSVQTWEAVTTPGADKRIKSFVSVSGPNLDYLSEWARKNLSHPTPANLGKAFSQLGSSAYTGFFQAPVLPNLFWRTAGRPGLWREFLHRVEGTPKENIVLADTFTADTVSGLRYYRANIREKLATPDPRPTQVPVLEVVNERDVALRPAIYDYTYTHAAKLWRRNSSTGHWLPYTKPDYLASTAVEFIDSIEGRSSDSRPNSLERARVLAAPSKFTGKLAVVTGAGSGIGRETAYALAERGCEIIVADLDFTAAENTVRECKAKGVQAHSYALDVSDVAAFNEFAATVARKHGVPDVVVNNAGIGLGGSALAATDEQLDRVLAVNLRGVMTGSRAFGRQMVERGIGGNIVNIASAAAFTPQRDLGIYAASKAGVLLFSESLRAELAEHRIGVTAICPGIVNTNIVSNTPLAGYDDAAVEQEHRDKLDKLYQRRNFGPEKVARDIVAALESNKAVAPVTPEAKIGYRVYRFTPWLARLMARGDILR
ncbi:putative oxidoreductase [Gordonia effusa NBRC 100432]|uniref:Putative oxidoreductase n=1 Tax=Gordonia effusa NBRC 100432 TaxID=1077974 RepID=H0QWW3_9ACTN|nr:SDR family oxidoreductase [Gordonia effusa]GAB17314.1 putative oxidoreductase [Gordonia effusa NBRC 100432]